MLILFPFVNVKINGINKDIVRMSFPKKSENVKIVSRYLIIDDLKIYISIIENFRDNYLSNIDFHASSNITLKVNI